MSDGSARAWRVRKLHRHIDARLRRGDDGVELELIYGERVIYRRRWETWTEAEADSIRRRADLERAGWTEHW